MNEISLPKKIGCIIIAIVTSFITFSVGIVGDLSLNYIAMFLTVPTYAAMILLYPNYIYALFPIMSFVGVYLMTDDIINTIICIMFLILSAICAEGVLKKRTKYNTIVRMSIVMFFASVFMFSILIYSTYGSLSRETIIGFGNEILEMFLDYFESTPLMDIATIDAYKSMLIELSYALPGSLLFLFALLSYVSCTFTRKIVYWFNGENRLFNFDNKWEFEMPIESAYIYILSYALLFVLPLVNVDTPALKVAIYAILYPSMAGMIISGLKQIKAWLKQKRTGKALFIVLIVLTLLFFTNLALSITGFIGVYRCFVVNKETKWTVEK